MVRETLLEYARRGVFRGFEHRDTDRGEDFWFHWIGPRAFHVTYDREEGTIAARELLPGAGSEPSVREDLDRLLRERMEGTLPHRSLDPDKAEVALVDPGEGDLDLVLRVRDEDLEYGARKLLNLVNEIWVRLNDRHQRYLWEHFDAPME